MIGLTAVFAFLWTQNSKRLALVRDGGAGSSGITTTEGTIKAQNLILALLSFLPMFLVNACMEYVGNDYQNYYLYYRNIMSGAGQDVEITFHLISLLAAELGLGFQGVYYIYSLINHILLLVCIRRFSDNYAVSYLMFFLNGFFFYLGLNQIRQFTSVMLVFYAYRYIREKKPLRYLICVGLAATFHVTAAVMLPFYWILKTKWKLSTYCVVAVLLAPVNLFYTEVITWLFQNFMPRYLNTNYATREFSMNIRYLCVVVLTLVIALIYEKKSREDNTVFRNGLMLSNLIVLFASWLPEYQRFVFYFFVPSIAFIPHLVEKDESRLRRIGVYVILLGVYFWYFRDLYPGMGVIPYKSIFG